MPGRAGLHQAFCHWAYELPVLHNTTGTQVGSRSTAPLDRKSTRLNSSHVRISYAVFCLKKKTSRGSPAKPPPPLPPSAAVPPSTSNPRLPLPAPPHPHPPHTPSLHYTPHCTGHCAPPAR